MLQDQLTLDQPYIISPPFADATCGTLRLKLFKIGARVTVSARRVKLAMTSPYPWRNEWALVHARLSNAA